MLGRRLGKYGLTRHETQTQFLEFRPPRGENVEKGKPGSSSGHGEVALCPCDKVGTGMVPGQPAPAAAGAVCVSLAGH